MAYTQEMYNADVHMFSDMHKEAYGCRPHAVPTPSIEDMPSVIEEMGKWMQWDQEYERQRAITAQFNFYRSVEFHQRREGCTRQEAVRYLVNRATDSFAFDGLLVMVPHDFESVCYHLGFPYALEQQIRFEYTGSWD